MEGCSWRGARRRGPDAFGLFVDVSDTPGKTFLHRTYRASFIALLLSIHMPAGKGRRIRDWDSETDGAHLHGVLVRELSDDLQSTAEGMTTSDR